MRCLRSGPPPQSQARPRFSGPLERMGRGAGLRTGTGRVQTPGHVRSPVSFDHLSLPLGAVALRSGDNMLDGRPRDPDLFRDRRGPEPGLECS